MNWKGVYVLSEGVYVPMYVCVCSLWLCVAVCVCVNTDIKLSHWLFRMKDWVGKGRWEIADFLHFAISCGKMLFSSPARVTSGLRKENPRKY